MNFVIVSNPVGQIDLGWIDDFYVLFEWVALQLF